MVLKTGRESARTSWQEYFLNVHSGKRVKKKQTTLFTSYDVFDFVIANWICLDVEQLGLTTGGFSKE